MNNIIGGKCEPSTIDDPMLLANDLMYSYAIKLEALLQQKVRNSSQRINLIEIKAIFIQQILQNDAKLIHVDSTFIGDKTTTGAIAICHDNFPTHILFLLIKIDCNPKLSFNLEINRPQEEHLEQALFLVLPIQLTSKTNQDKPIQQIDKKQFLLDLPVTEIVTKSQEYTTSTTSIGLESIAQQVKQVGYKYFSERERLEITLHSALCAIMYCVGDHLMYEIYKPSEG
jgi:hypothetical protein